MSDVFIKPVGGWVTGTENAIIRTLDGTNLSSGAINSDGYKLVGGVSNDVDKGYLYIFE